MIFNAHKVHAHTLIYTRPLAHPHETISWPDKTEERGEKDGPGPTMTKYWNTTRRPWHNISKAKLSHLVSSAFFVLPLEDLQEICTDYFNRMYLCEGQKWDLEFEVSKREFEVLPPLQKYTIKTYCHPFPTLLSQYETLNRFSFLLWIKNYDCHFWFLLSINNRSQKQLFLFVIPSLCPRTDCERELSLSHKYSTGFGIGS